MKNEMEILSMDERQQLSWLRANRLTLFVVGLVWLALIGWEIVSGRLPYFMIIMVPVFALIRLLSYYWFQRRG